MKLLTAAGDGKLERNDFTDGRPKEDSSVMSSLQSCGNDRPYSSHMTPPTAATVPQESVIAMDGRSVTLAGSPSMIPASDYPGRPQQVVEVAYDKQEWEICNIISKEDVDGIRPIGYNGVPHWCPNLKWGRQVVASEAQLRAHGRQMGGKGRGRLPLSKAGKQAIAGARATGKTQQKKGRGRPRKQGRRSLRSIMHITDQSHDLLVLSRF